MREASLRVSHRLFRDREDAGSRLAGALACYGDQHALVLAIPRGGVPVAAIVARELGADLDIVVARKLGAPHNPELAIGAVTANGGIYLNHELVVELGIPAAYLEDVIARERAEAQRRETRLRGGHQPVERTGRIIIVIDDGLATGATMRAALRSVRRSAPAALVAAVPVGSNEACSQLQQEADEVVCLYRPSPFWAVGLHYARFDQVSDAQVIQLLEGFLPPETG